MKKSVLGSLVILAILMIGFPLISIKYLNKGVDYRKKHLATLMELGDISSFQATNRGGKTLDPTLLLGKVTAISHELNACDPKVNKTVSEYVAKFIKQDDFRHIILTDRAECEEWSQSYKAEISDNSELFHQYKEHIALGDEDHALIIVDREGQLRRIYNLTLIEDLEALVTHTMILMPPLKKR